VKTRFVVVAAIGVAFGALASCGDEPEGQPCQDSTECPQIDCGQGVHVRVCVDDLCVTDQNDACKLAETGGGGSGGGI
jgi:hypothetical protein